MTDLCRCGHERVAHAKTSYSQPFCRVFLCCNKTTRDPHVAERCPCNNYTPEKGE